MNDCLEHRMADRTMSRRPIAARNAWWAKALAGWLARRGVKPNAISVFSVFCAAVSFGAFSWTRSASLQFVPWLFVVGAAGIQARLLCNLFDGMVAVEGGLRTKSGEIYNELPDRIACGLFIIGFAPSIGSSGLDDSLGWAAALLAVFTAYIRTLGASAGAGQEFCGPMAKQQRMFVVTVASLWAAGEVWFQQIPGVITLALMVIVVGCVVTCARRTFRIVRALESK